MKRRSQNLRKMTVNNAENNLLIQKFNKQIWKKLMKTKKVQNNQ